ncbi:MAG: hypothetical protein DPW09_11015 [Anaerolineae bacterium]|nr:hypothetical protein [Anaerolineae bacterium]
MIPRNEMGVIVLFTQEASAAGFEIVEIQSAFPDAIIKHKGQTYRAEFEYKSSNCIHHRHDPRLCDIVICWENDIPDAFLPVIVLSDQYKELIL